MSRLIEAEQGSEAWLQSRAGFATASRFNDILATTKTGYGASRKNYLAEIVVQRLTGEVQDSFKTAAMQFGSDMEATARLTYELETGDSVEETGFWQHDTIRAGASPDGLIGEIGLIEIKSPNLATHIETLHKQDVPKQYIAQIQGQLWITGRDWCDFVSYTPYLEGKAQLFIKRVDRDDAYIKNLTKEVTKFLEEVDNEVDFITNYKGE